MPPPILSELNPVGPLKSSLVELLLIVQLVIFITAGCPKSSPLFMPPPKLAWLPMIALSEIFTVPPELLSMPPPPASIVLAEIVQPVTFSVPVLPFRIPSIPRSETPVADGQTRDANRAFGCHVEDAIKGSVNGQSPHRQLVRAGAVDG